MEVEMATDNFIWNDLKKMYIITRSKFSINTYLSFRFVELYIL